MESDKNLTVFATHRAVKTMPFVDLSNIESSLGEFFDFVEYPSLEELMNNLEEHTMDKSFGYSGGGKYFLLNLKYGKSIDDLVKEEKSFGLFPKSDVISAIKYIVKVIIVNRITVNLFIFFGTLLKKIHIRAFQLFYRQAYSYYNRRAFKRRLSSIRKGV